MPGSATTKRADILDATLRLLAAHDLQATSMARIAAEAGVGMGTIYNYFDGKQDLLLELYRELRHRLRDAIYAAFPDDASHREQFLHVWRTLARHYLAHPEAYLFEVRFETSPFVRDSRLWQSDEFWDKLNAAFRGAQAAGAIRPIRLEHVLPMVRGAIGALVRDHITGRTRLDDETLETVIGVLWDAIAEPVPPAAGS